MESLGKSEMRPTAMVSRLSGAHEDIASSCYKLGGELSAKFPLIFVYTGIKRFVANTVESLKNNDRQLILRRAFLGMERILVQGSLVFVARHEETNDVGSMPDTAGFTFQARNPVPDE